MLVFLSGMEQLRKELAKEPCVFLIEVCMEGEVPELNIL